MRPHRTSSDLGDVPAPGESSAGAPLADPHPHANGASGHGDETSAASQPSLDEVQGDSEQILRLFEMTGDLLATLSPEGRLTLLNPAWEQTLGWRREELLQRPLQELLHPDDVERTLTLLLAGGGGVTQLENFTSRLRHRDGSWHTLLWGARAGDNRWYEKSVPAADALYDSHLEELRREGEIE